MRKWLAERAKLAWISGGLVATLALASALVASGSSCGQTPTNVAVRTFEGAGRMDILCLQVLGEGDAGAGPIPAVAVSLDHCAPVATGVDPTTLTFHTIAVVTQTLRGELAVVDLTLGRVIDTSRALPGINFLPVGKNPTDVAVTPDAQMVFVTAAETNKPAIYGIPATHLLGDSEILDEPSQAAEQVSLPTWPACALPQAPGRMVIVPTGGVPGDAGGGATQGYEIVVVMPGNGVDEQAEVGLIDTAAFTDGTIAPGSLTKCPLKSVIQLAENKSALPAAWTPGPNWPNGVPYATDGGAGDGGIDLFSSRGSGPVQPSGNYNLPLWSCPGLAHVGAVDGGAPDASPVTTTPGKIVHGGGIATDGRFVWVSDVAMPFIHVIDTQTPGTLTEIAPLLATSIIQPSRVVTTSELAVSPVTRDYKRFLYAIDPNGLGSIMIYDVTDPVNGPRTPLTRPNGELDPLQAPDRILLSSPVATIAFARHDFPVPSQSQGGVAQTGLLCNPNPNAGDLTLGAPTDPGAYYRENGTISVPLGPKRLRGVFAFATMTNGQVVAIDVDDWDAPCRRPIYLNGAPPGALALAQQVAGSGDLDPYKAPTAGPDSGISVDGGVNQWVTNEGFWPVIQPNRVRSVNLLEDDPTGGLHAPALTTTPILLVNSAPVSLTDRPYPVLTGALPEFASSVVSSPQNVPNVFMAHDIPDVHVDQTWNIVYEGVLPGLDGIVANVGTDDGYSTMSFSSATAFFCGHGIEDHRLGLQRFAAMQVDDAVMTKPTDTTTYIPILFDQRVGDYVQITDDITGGQEAGVVPDFLDDPIWLVHNDCWNDMATTKGESLAPDNDDNVGMLRQQVCIDKFGIYGADQNVQRDFPILEATESKLVLGRYGYTDTTNRPTNGRLIVPRDTSPQADFKLAQCCFHNQAHFRVRTGAEWVALGANNLYLHHVVADASGACVDSCDSRLVLMNSRTPELSVFSTLPTAANPTRNSPFAMRNPAFSFFLAAPVAKGDDAKSAFSISIRDDTYQFSTRGSYGAQGISLTTLSTSVSPRSSMFVGPLGAIAVVDASAEGLFIIDLNTLAIADGSPFF